MVSLSGFLIIYVLGGLTFVPLILGAILLHAHLTLPIRDPSAQATDEAHNDKSRDIGDGTEDVAGLPEQLKRPTRESDVAAGYFAVCREFVPGGVNGKPPERTTPAGEVVAPESPSVYQSMYRHIFDRNKSKGPTLDHGKGGNAPQKRARNVFYVVLRHGHLMLYDDSDQIEVRHVISLVDREVDIYGGNEVIPEGELFIKRNCIRMVKSRTKGELEDPKPFYLFSENCSEKEDFYHAMLANKDQTPGLADGAPRPLKFDPAHIVKLVQQLHASEENLQTRWINALIGRIFLSVHKTPELEDFIRSKFTKKIARVQKPNFISSIKVQTIDMGDAAPYITHPKLKEISVDGELNLETNIHYRGNFSMVIVAVARIDLGTHFKAREVTLTLSGLLKKLDGHMFIRVKPPPSNRIWISFESPPQVEMTIEPIVSTRQITYSVILRAIESRIREVIAETLVYPNWDDIPFFETFLQRFRGGIWEDDVKLRPSPDHNTEAAEKGLVDDIDKNAGSSDEELPAPSQKLKEKTTSVPSLIDTGPSSLKARLGLTPSSVSVDATLDHAASSGIDGLGSDARPRAMRSSSFATAATPVVSIDAATAAALAAPKNKTKHSDAHSTIKGISIRAPPTSPPGSPYGSPPQPSNIEQAETLTERGSPSSTPSQDSQENLSSAAASIPSDPPSRTSTRASVASTETSQSTDSVKSKYVAAAANFLQSRPAVNNAAGAAKKWFAARQAAHSPSSSKTKFSAKDAAHLMAHDKSSAPNELNTSAKDEQSTLAPGTPSNPMGRGHPLPPLGQPLPHPQRQQTTGGWFINKRKQAPAQPSPVPAPAPTSTDSGMPAQIKRRTSSTASGSSETRLPPTNDASLSVPASIDTGEPTSSLPERPENTSSRTVRKQSLGSIDISSPSSSPNPSRSPALSQSQFSTPMPRHNRRSSAHSRQQSRQEFLQEEPEQEVMVVAAPVEVETPSVEHAEEVSGLGVDFSAAERDSGASLGAMEENDRAPVSEQVGKDDDEDWDGAWGDEETDDMDSNALGITGTSASTDPPNMQATIRTAASRSTQSTSAFTSSPSASAFTSTPKVAPPKPTSATPDSSNAFLRAPPVSAALKAASLAANANANASSRRPVPHSTAVPALTSTSTSTSASDGMPSSVSNAESKSRVTTDDNGDKDRDNVFQGFNTMEM